MSVQLSTSRLRLRPIGHADADSLTSVLGDAEVMKFSETGQPLDPQAIRQWLRKEIENSIQPNHQVFAVIVTATDQLIGYCGLYSDIYDNQPETEIGYRLAKATWGHGYATEAAKAVLDYGHKALKLKRIVAAIDPNNKASLRVAEKLGMKYEKDIMKPGYSHPDLLYVSNSDIQKIK